MTLVLLSNMTKIIIMAEDQAPKRGKFPELPGCYHHKGRLVAADVEGIPGWVRNWVLTQGYGTSPDKNTFQWLITAFIINEKII